MPMVPAQALLHDNLFAAEREKGDPFCWGFQLDPGSSSEKQALIHLPEEIHWFLGIVSRRAHAMSAFVWSGSIFAGRESYRGVKRYVR